MSRLRAAIKLVELGTVLACAAPRFIRPHGEPRALLHRLCSRLTRLFKVRLTVAGPVPSGGLIVCNHLSYLDIIILGGVIPTAFVAKREVGSWPVFGWFARRSGTIFVARERRSDSARACREIQSALARGGCVVLFPEGTSSGGDTVLPFKSSLLEPAVDGPVTTASIHYRLEPGQGDPAEKICYWRDMTLFPHLLGVLGMRTIHARLVFDRPQLARGDRKALAVELRARVLALKGAAAQELQFHE